MGDMAGVAKAVLCMTDSVEVYGPCTCRLKEYGTFTNTFTIVRGCVQSFFGHTQWKTERQTRMP